MCIKNFFRTITLALFCMICVNAHSATVITANYDKTTLVSKPDNDSLKVEQMKQRLAIIQQMDLANLSVDEKKALKKELREMKKQADGLDSRIYLSVGAVIIIILLLILILR